MAGYIALLRGINVGGRKMVAMSDLRTMLESLGFSGARSILQSGNLAFQSTKRSAAALERLLEEQTEQRLKVSVHYLVRSAAEWGSIIDHNPFPKEAKQAPSHLLVVCLKKEPDRKAVKSLCDIVQGPEVVHADGKQLYIVYPAGIGESKLTHSLVERMLGIRGTARNWNTVVKLAALLRG